MSRTIWYRMLLKDAKLWIGPYQTDREDFLKLWQHVKKDVKRCYVWRYNDDDTPPTVWAWDETFFHSQWVECLGDVSNIAR